LVTDASRQRLQLRGRQRRQTNKQICNQTD